MQNLANRIFHWPSLSAEQRREVLRRPAALVAGEVAAATAKIVADVRQRGDAALRDYAARFDGFTGGDLRVSAAEWDEGVRALGGEQRRALERAVVQLRRFHQAEMPQSVALEVSPGIHCRRLWRPIERVGLYVPAGTAPLPSTVLMLALPAALAGCRERVICTPAGKDGKVHPGILTAARLADATQIYKVGGAHGIAALAYGTESVPKVDKVFGPGNAYVTQAKVLASLDPDGAASDLPAGPSEVMVLVDDTAIAKFAAADLLSQAEHGADSQVVLVALSRAILDATLTELADQLARLPRRAIASTSLQKAAFILATDATEAIAIANAYAPEHLIIQLADAASYVDRVHHAGSIFLGPWSPEAVGDYASGTNHVLPTYGQARSHGGLCMESFMKSMTVQELTRPGLNDIGPVVVTLATMEGLGAHAHAVRVRLEATEP